MTSGLSGLVTINVTGRFTDLSDRPANGHVLLVPTHRVAGNGWIVVGTPVRLHIRNGLVTGQIIVNQAALDEDLYIRVTEQITGEQPQQSPYVVKPEGTSLDLTTAPRVANPPPGTLYVPASALGQPDGVATLGPDGKLTVSQRPPGGGGGVTSHHDLEDLADGDDHPQYLNQARGDARYAGKTETQTALAGKENTGTAAAAVAAHVALPDPHAQYLNNTRGDARYVRPSQLAQVSFTGSYTDMIGTVPTSALPALAITDVFTVNSQAEMLGLTAQRGDIAIRVDQELAYILAADDPTVLANWRQLPVPAGGVISVNGQTGVVVLGKADIGLDQVANLPPSQLPISDATQTAINNLVDSINARMPVSLINNKGDLLAGMSADQVGVLSVGLNGQALLADSSALLGVRWGTVSGGGGNSLNSVAVRYGCKAITLDPHDLSWVNPQYLALVDFRHYQYWVPLSPGETITGVRLPIQLQGSGSGALRFAVYQEDLSLLGQTADVAFAMSNPAVAQTWQTIPLIVPAATTGAGVWITALSSMSTGPKVCFCNTNNSPDLPGWLLNPSTHRTAVRTEGVTNLPTTLAPESGALYIDFIIGVY